MSASLWIMAAERSRWWWIVAMLVGSLSLPLSACGPWIPQSWLYAREDFLVAAPVLSFESEVKQLFPDGPSPLQPSPSASAEEEAASDGMVAIEAAEIRSVLASQGVADIVIAPVLEAFHRFREDLTDYKLAHQNRWESGSQVAREMEERAEVRLRGTALPSEMPDEFRLYLEGARAFHLGDVETAARFWQNLLELPEDQRRHRTVWAHYMLGRLWASKAPALAAESLRKARDAFHQGFSDPLHLALDSLGEEARIHFREGEPERALELYLAQFHAGHRGGYDSLVLILPRVLEEADFATWQRLARHPVSRRLISSYLLSVGRYEEDAARFRQHWLNTLRRSGLSLPTEASRLALLAYQGNLMQETAEWLQLAPRIDPLAQWIQAKLELRAGDFDKGQAMLRNLFADLPPSFEQYYDSDDWDASFRRFSQVEESTGLSTARVGLEGGLLALSLGEFVDALEAFWKARQWREVAYLSERVLTTEELLRFGETAVAEERREGDDFPPRMADLIARRLTREGRFEEARHFFTPRKVELLDRYNAAVRAGFDFDQSNEARAEAFWQAARLMRENGRSLVATELAPDFGWFDCEYELGDERRREFEWDNPLHPTYAEFERTEKTEVEPNKRFHYRYLAAEWAAFAAQLLPVDDVNAARLLITAGNWIEQSDPTSAEHYYRQLVVQCGRHPLGQVAEKLHWFPARDAAPFAEMAVAASPVAGE